MIPTKASGILVFIFLLGGLILFSQTVGHSLASYFFGPYGPALPLTTHIVLFQFKEAAAPFAVKEIISIFLGLKTACVHPTTQKPYIISIAGGKDISIEGLQNGISHAFVLQFLSKEDRNYYVNEDPFHRAFKEAAGEVLENALVVDFQDGVFTKTE